MTLSVIQISQYICSPPLQIVTGSTLEVRGWYSRDFISADGVTPLFGNSSSGEQGPYFSTTPTLNGSGDLVVPAHNVQATTLSNPTANYFEGLWVNGAFSALLMPNTNGATGWQIPTTYGPVIAFDEIATYNRARRLVYPPDTYFTATQTLQEIERILGQQSYMAVGVNGIGSASVPPVLASLPIVVMNNDPRVMSNLVNVKAYPYYAVGDGSADDTAAITAAMAAIDAMGGGTLYLPIGVYNITGLVAGASASQHKIGILGESTVGTKLRYIGATNGIALTLRNEKYVPLQNFQILNGVAKGTTEGIRMTGTSGGTNTTGPVLSLLAVDGFHTGLRSSDGAGRTSSEVTAINFTAQNCDTGILNDDFNGLNLSFINLQMAANAVGLDAFTGGIHVWGGTSTGNGIDFRFANDDTSSIIGFRSEAPTSYSVDFASAAAGNTLTLLNYEVIVADDPSTHTVIRQTGGQLSIKDGHIGGLISFQPGSAIFSLELTNCHIIDPNNTFTSIATPDNMGPGFRVLANSGGGGRFVSTGNSRCDVNFNNVVGTWPDGQGYIAVSPSGQGIAVFKAAIGAGIALAVSGNAIAPTSAVHSVGAGLIKNITVSSGFNMGLFYAIPTAAFTTDVTGNIGKATTATIGQLMTFAYDGVSKWWPSY